MMAASAQGRCQRLLACTQHSDFMMTQDSYRCHAGCMQRVAAAQAARSAEGSRSHHSEALAWRQAAAGLQGTRRICDCGAELRAQVSHAMTHLPGVQTIGACSSLVPPWKVPFSKSCIIQSALYQQTLGILSTRACLHLCSSCVCRWLAMKQLQRARHACTVLQAHWRGRAARMGTRRIRAAITLQVWALHLPKLLSACFGL